MQRRFAQFPGLLVGVILLLMPLRVMAQDSGSTNTSSVCVLAFEDNNENGVRDAGEIPLPGISVHLAVNTDVIVRTHITTADNRHYCFENLENNIYNLYFAESVNHRATTESSAAVQLENSQRFRVEFGAISQSPFRDAADAATEEDTSEELDTSTRLIFAAVGAILVMLFMFGLGIIVASILY